MCTLPPPHTHTKHTHTHTQSHTKPYEGTPVDCASLAWPQRLPITNLVGCQQKIKAFLVSLGGAEQIAWICLVLPWLWSQHQTHSFCAVCSRCDNAGWGGGREKEGEVPQPRELEGQGLRHWLGSIPFALKKDGVPGSRHKRGWSWHLSLSTIQRESTAFYSHSKVISRAKPEKFS
jgi:hypothetical protein